MIWLGLILGIWLIGLVAGLVCISAGGADYHIEARDRERLQLAGKIVGK